MELLDYIPETYTDLLREELSKYTTTGDNPREDVVKGGLEKNRKIMLAVFTILGLAGLFYKFYLKPEYDYNRINAKLKEFIAFADGRIKPDANMEYVSEYEKIFREKITEVEENIKIMINIIKNDTKLNPKFKQIFPYINENVNLLEIYRNWKFQDWENNPNIRKYDDLYLALRKLEAHIFDNKRKETADNEKIIKETILNDRIDIISSMETHKMIDALYEFFNHNVDIKEMEKFKVNIDFVKNAKNNLVAAIISDMESIKNILGNNFKNIYEKVREYYDIHVDDTNRNQIRDIIAENGLKFRRVSGGYNFQFFIVIILVTIIILLVFMIFKLTKKNGESFKIELNKLI